MDSLAYENKKYTYEDIEKLPGDTRYEIINGELFIMESPHGRHQLLLGELYGQLREYLKDKKCTVFLAPFDVALSKSKKKNEIYNVVQPDIMVLCDMSKYEGQRIFGGPDFIIEIVSPFNKSHDYYRKFNLYQQYGVKEYWLVDYKENVILPYILNEKGVYELPKAYRLDEEIKVHTLKNMSICLKEFLAKNADFLKEEEEEYKLFEQDS